ncbi:MAG: hypothetical protein ACN4G0_05835 [Polyangiales bacterium]
MKLNYVRLTLTPFFLYALTLSACGSESQGEKPPVVVMNIGGDSGFTGCVRPSYPPEQPNLSIQDPALFVTDNENMQATARPGAAIEARITVNAATRYARVDLQDAWDRIPERRRPFATWEPENLPISGGRTLDVILFTDVNQRFGRYYMKVTLCGLDCDEQEVVFDINPDVNENYERTVFEDGFAVQVDRTCIDLIPQGTVLIQ